MLQNVRDDLSKIYASLGYDCIRPDDTVVKVIQDNTLKVDDSDLIIVRALTGHGISRAEVVMFRGYSHQVVRVTLHEEVENEELLSLKRMS